MALELTERALRESEKLRIEPQLVLEIEGITTLFGAVQILRQIRIGDDGLLIGDDWRIGGLVAVDDQEDIISLESGSGTEINQQLDPFKGSVSSVSSVQLQLSDRRLLVSQIISPGVVLQDILGVKAHLWLGFKNTAWKEDYIKVFSGIIDEVESGSADVKINLAHPEQLKRQKIFQPVAVLLDGAHTDSDTTIALLSTENVLTRVLGPDGAYDDAIDFYVKIDDEIILYTGITGNTITGCSRGALGTSAAAHGNLAEGKTLVQIEDTVINIALKIMLSGRNGFYKEDVPVGRYLHPEPTTTVANSVFFDQINIETEYGATVGDYITITDATNGANNCSLKPILEIGITEDGSYVVVGGGVAFIEEPDSPAVAAFRSQYDTLGEGLNLTPDQVDVAEHVFWDNFQLGSSSYRFVIQDAIEGKQFLDEQVYKPVGAYSIPRKGRASMGYHTGPIARDILKVIDRTNVKDPDKIRLKRTINRDFANTVVFQFDKNELDGQYKSGSINVSQTSKNRIPVGNKTISINSEGMRRNLDGAGTALRVASRYLGRYQLAAESFERIGVLFKTGFAIEPGDLVLLDSEGLNITNTEDGTRDKRTKLFEVRNRKINLKTGDVTLALTDTDFGQTERYGVVSPSSVIVSGTTTELLIEDSYGAFFPENESRKWEDYIGLPIIVHSEDWSYSEEVTLEGIDPGNKYKLLVSALSGAPSAGYIIDIADYPTDTDPNVNDRYKAVHAFWGPAVEIVSGADDFNFDVDSGDVSKFKVGGLVRVHSLDYSSDSGEVEISDISGDTITVASSLGFTPQAGDTADSMGFADGSETYRIF